MQRLLTAAVGVPLFLVAVFLLPPWAFFLLLAVIWEWTAVELVRVLRPCAPNAPLWLLPVLVPLTAVALELLPAVPRGDEPFLLAAFAGSVGLGTLVLAVRTPVDQALATLGALGFGSVYLALPLVAGYRIQALDPWLVLLLVAIVWLGDTAAYYVGRRFGRHKLAPVISPQKSWEGAAASFAAALAAAAAWGLVRLGTVPVELLALAAATAVAAQVGDLVESMLKRGSGVKDSGTVLPGHGGMLDRLDAILFAAPVMLGGLLWLGPETLIP
jgi:phosphatidate cytidylyltransferase